MTGIVNARLTDGVHTFEKTQILIDTDKGASFDRNKTSSTYVIWTQKTKEVTANILYRDQHALFLNNSYNEK